MGHDTVERCVVGLGFRRGDTFECRAVDAHAEPEDPRPRQVGYLVGVVGPDESREVRPVLLGVEREEPHAVDAHDVDIGKVLVMYRLIVSGSGPEGSDSLIG